MTRRSFEQVHTELASGRFKQLRATGYRGNDIGRRSFAETEQAARDTYRALPWWYRWGLVRGQSPRRRLPARQQDA